MNKNALHRSKRWRRYEKAIHFRGDLDACFIVSYRIHLICFEVLETELFSDWVDHLKDPIGRAKILARITRFEAGHFGEVESLGEGVIEAKIKGKGPGYRLYYARQGIHIILLLCGGDKSTQSKDIALAKELWARRRS